jgi:WD40 repeat protein/uncharacterized caspase-like protein
MKHVFRSTAFVVAIGSLFAPGLSAKLSAQGKAPQSRFIVQTGHHPGVRSVAISKDGKYVLTSGGHDAMLMLWETRTGRIVRRYQHEHATMGVQFSPDEREAWVYLHGTSRIDLETGKQLGSSLMWCAPATRDGTLTVTGNANTGKISLVDVHKMEVIRTYRDLGHAHPNYSVYAISPDGKTVAAGKRDHAIQLFDVEGKELEPLVGHTAQLASLRFSPDGKQLVSMSTDNTVRLWDLAPAKEVRRLEGETVYEDAPPPAFSPDGRLIALAREGGTDIWTAGSDEIIARIPGYVGPRTFSADGNLLVVGKNVWEPGAILWDLRTKQVVQRFEDRTSPVTSLSFSPDSRQLLLRNFKAAAVWDLARGKERLRLPRPQAYDRNNTKFVGDGKRILISGDGVQLVDAETGKATGGAHQVSALMALSPDEKRVAGTAYWAQSDTLVVWDFETRKEAFRKSFPTYITGIGYTADGRRLLVHTAHLDGGTTCFDAATFKEIWNVKNDADSWTHVGVVPSPDSTSFLLLRRPEAELREVATGKLIHSFESRHRNSGAFSADGSRVLIGSGSIARLFDTQTFKQISQFEYLDNEITSVALSPDGKWAATGAQDGAVRLWDASTGAEMCKLFAFDDGTWAGVDADGRFDASEARKIEGAHWVVEKEPLLLSQLTERCFEPGLVAKALGFSREPRRKAGPIPALQLPPEITLESDADGKLTVHALNRGSGIGRLQVLVDGKEHLADARGASADPMARKAGVAIDLSSVVRHKSGSGPVVEIVGWNAAGDICSRPVRYVTSGQESPANIPTLTIQAGHEGIESVAMSKDGKLVLTTGGDLNAILWEASTGRILRRFVNQHVTHFASFALEDREVIASVGQASRFDTNAGNRIQSSGWSVRGLTRDGKHAIAINARGETCLLDARSLAPIRRFGEPQKAGNADSVVAAISSNGKFVARAGEDHLIRIWDLADKEQKPLQGHTRGIRSFDFSPDGSLGVSNSIDKTVRLWDIASAKEVRRLQLEESTPHNIRPAVFSPDGNMIAAPRQEWTELWDVKSGEIKNRVRFDWGPRAFSPDSKLLLLGNHHGNMPYASMWDLAKKEEVRRFMSRTSSVASVSLSPDLRRLLTRNQGQVVLWDLVSGRQDKTLPRAWMLDFGNTMFLGDGKRALVHGHDGTEVIDPETGKTLVGAKEVAGAPSISPDETLVAGRPTNELSDKLVVCNLRTQQEVFRKEFGGDLVFATIFTSDGKRLLVGGGSGRLTCFETETFKQLWSILPDDENPSKDKLGGLLHMVCAPDSRTFIASHAHRAQLRDLATGRLLHDLNSLRSAHGRAAFSPDGKRLLIGGYYRTACLYDTKTFEEIVAFEGHEDAIVSTALSPDGKLAITGSRDCTTRIWDAAAGKELCKLVTFDDGSWAAIDSEGRFDASNGGNVEGLHWVVGNEAIALGQLKERYYDPGLVAKILGHSKEPLRKVDAFRSVQLHPTAAVDAPTDDGKLKVRLENRGGGIGRVQVLVNGKELLADARGPGVDPKAQEATLVVDLANAPSLKPGQKNVVEVVTWNAEGYLSNRGIQRLYTAKGTAQQDIPELHAIIVGVSEYANPALNLRYSSKDAVDIASALELGAKKLFGADKSHITLLVNDKDGKHLPPTRANIEKAFAAARSAKPGDVFVVYLAGHGVALPGDADQYCYLTSDARTADPAVLSDPAVASQYAVSGADLTEWIKKVPALKQVMVLDTCAAGAVAKKLTEQRSVSGEQIRAIERLKDRTGFHILMGCASDKVSYEATQFSQGLLTHSLLKAMRGAALRENEYVDVGSLFQYAADEVPRLAKNIGGIQKPLIAAPRGSSFDIGRLTTEEKQRVPLASPLPIVLRPLLINPDEGDDNLGLMPRLRRTLADALVQNGGERPPAVYVDSDEMPGAIRPAGTYVLENGTVRVRVNLRRDGATIASANIEGPSNNLGSLIDAVSKEIVRKLPR